MPLSPDDIEITFFRGSGPGGQHRNTTESGVRVRHLPTGIVVIAQNERSQHRNKAIALEELERRIAARNRRRKPRHKTRPTLASKRRRIEGKKQQSQKKERRKPPDPD